MTSVCILAAETQSLHQAHFPIPCNKDPKMADKVKEVAREEAEHIKTQTIQAARSAAYLYPLRASNSNSRSQQLFVKPAFD